LALTGLQKSAEGIVGTDVLKARTVGRRTPQMWDRGSAPGQQLELPFAERRGEAAVGASGWRTPVREERLMERVVERGQLLAALRRVKRNGGSPGSEGMTVEECPGYLREPWPQLREALVAGTYRPQPVKRVESPKPGGGVRKRGVPTVVDRCLQQAVLQVLPPEGDKTFSEGSYGVRPGRSAPQAVARAQRELNAGSSWVVDLDLEKVFDRVHPDKLLSRVQERVADRRVFQLIDRDLKAGALTDEGLEATAEGTPQGGPVSPLRATLLVDGLAKELARRGPRVVRYADEGNLYVKSARAGQRVRASVTRFLTRRLKLTVNAAKRAVDRPGRRTFLGFTCTGRRPNRRRGSDKALTAYKPESRRLTSRTRGVSGRQVVHDVQQYVTGWYAYLGVVEVPSSCKELDSWLRRRRRCSLGKQWGRRRYRERRRRGGSRDLAWNTVKSAHGPWRLSRSPARAIALPGAYFDGLGLPRLHRGSYR
jgi:RNA-directed DNA polymerase